jgi:hypothetical protein
MDFSTYADQPGLNASKLKAGRTSMKHMHHYGKHGKAPTAAMQKGTNIHAAVLEPERFWAHTIATDLNRRTNDYKQLVEDNPGATIITESEQAELEQIVDSVFANREARAIIESTAHEVSMFWDDRILGKGKCRMDGYSETSGLVLELKSGSTVEPRSFARQCYNMGYHIQIGWARYGLAQVEAKVSRILVVAVEQSPPYDCVVYEPDVTFVTEGGREAKEIARRYRAAQACGVYEGVSSEVVPLELPRWITGDTEVDISNGTMEAGEL